MPIAKAMAAAICTVACISAACAAPSDALQGKNEPRAIVSTDDGFAIRAASQQKADGHGAPTSAVHLKLVRIGTGVHLDARLLLRPASSIEENIHARR